MSEFERKQDAGEPRGEPQAARRADRPGRAGIGDLRGLRVLLGLLAPYRAQVAGAMLALVVAAATVRAFGAGLRWLVTGLLRR